MNIKWSKRILKQLHSEGVREVVFCAGARNSPLVSVLDQTEGLTRYSFFEERSASFFALGCARRSGRPVAVITTSGTAVAELLPAVIEAFHTGVPLILVTADRPRRLRGTGAPQAIDQTGIFAKFISREFDLEGGEGFSLEGWSRRTPVHVNVCFDEPLIDEEIAPLVLDEDGANLEPFQGRSQFNVSAGAEWAALRIAKFLRGPGALLTVVGTLETEEEREAVCHLLLQLKSPVYLEGTSGLRERPELQDFAVRSGDKLLSWGLRRGLFGRVLRIGGVPTVRIWRDLEEPTCPVDVLSLTSLPFAGLSRGEMVCSEIAPAARLAAEELHTRTAAPFLGEASLRLLTKDRETEAKLIELFEREPLAEPSLVRALSNLIPSPSLVYVGNSLPIREWDLAASYERVFPVEANRGVNGIDGQTSTFIGLTSAHRENWCVIGDLTALYDLASPWALAYRNGAPVRLVVINNGGGKIFSRIFRSTLFENRHALGFEGWARMWNLQYHHWIEIPADFTGSEADVIELKPDPEATQRFWDHYDRLWT